MPIARAHGRLHLVMLYDCRTVADRDRGIAAAVEAVKSGELVVLPTDTVYGDRRGRVHPARRHRAAERPRRGPPGAAAGAGRLPAHPGRPGLLAAQGGPRAGRRVLAGRADHHRRALAQPAVGPRRHRRHGRACGCRCTRSALEVLREVGPMAVTTANKIGQPAPTTAEEAREQLEYAVRIYLEAGPGRRPGAQHDRRRHRRRAAGAAGRRDPAGEAARRGAGHPAPRRR